MNEVSLYERYQELEKHITKGGDEFTRLGYGNELSASVRYDAILQYLLKLNVEESPFKSLLDAGAGLGSMWKFFAKVGGLDPLHNKGLREVILLDTKDEFLAELKDVSDNLSFATSSDGHPIQFWPERGDFTLNRLVKKYDVIVTCGALNVYPFDEFFKILDNMYDCAEKALIIESNVQSPETSWSQGNCNPSLDSIWQWLYSKHMYKGGTHKAQVTFIKKYTSVWLIEK